LAAELTARRRRISRTVVGELLKQLQFSLQGNIKTREGGDHAAAGATVSFHPRSDRQRFLPPPQPRHRRQVSYRPQSSIYHMGRGHRRGDGCVITPVDGRHSTRCAFRYSIDDKLTVPPPPLVSAQTRSPTAGVVI